MADITEVTIKTGDITSVTISDHDITALSVQSSEITTIMAAPATLNIGESLTASDDNPSDVARIASSGTSSLLSRADHVHSAANLLLDGGNY